MAPKVCRFAVRKTQNALITWCTSSGVDVVAEDARGRSPRVEDRAEHVEGRVGQAGAARSSAAMCSAAVDVLDADQPDEVRVRLVVVERQPGQLRGSPRPGRGARRRAAAPACGCRGTPAPGRRRRAAPCRRSSSRSSAWWCCVLSAISLIAGAGVALVGELRGWPRRGCSARVRSASRIRSGRRRGGLELGRLRGQRVSSTVDGHRERKRRSARPASPKDWRPAAAMWSPEN